MLLNESIVEETALTWLASLGYAILHGPEIAPGEPAAKRSDYGQVVLEDCLQDTPPPKLISSEMREKDAARLVALAT